MNSLGENAAHIKTPSFDSLESLDISDRLGLLAKDPPSLQIRPADCTVRQIRLGASDYPHGEPGAARLGYANRLGERIPSHPRPHPQKSGARGQNKTEMLSPCRRDY